MATKGNPERWAKVEFMVRLHREPRVDWTDDAVVALLVDDYGRAKKDQYRRFECQNEAPDETMYHAFLERVENLSSMDLAWALGMIVLERLEQGLTGSRRPAATP